MAFKETKTASSQIQSVWSCLFYILVSWPLHCCCVSQIALGNKTLTLITAVVGFVLHTHTIQTGKETVIGWEDATYWALWKSKFRYTNKKLFGDLTQLKCEVTLDEFGLMKVLWGIWLDFFRSLDAGRGKKMSRWMMGLLVFAAFIWISVENLKVMKVMRMRAKKFKSQRYYRAVSKY